MTVLFLIVLSAISASLQQAIIWVMKNLKKNSFGAREKGKLLSKHKLVKRMSIGLPISARVMNLRSFLKIEK